jgi:hypothetical protein
MASRSRAGPDRGRGAGKQFRALLPFAKRRFPARTGNLLSRAGNLLRLAGFLDLGRRGLRPHRLERGLVDFVLAPQISGGGAAHRWNEIALRIEQHQEGEGDYRTTLESLISVASRAADIFERSKTEQKRELIAFVFSNLRLRGKKLEYSLRSPFDLMVDRADHTSWLGFLNTVRTERFDHVLAIKALLPAIARAA